MELSYIVDSIDSYLESCAELDKEVTEIVMTPEMLKIFGSSNHRGIPVTEGRHYIIRTRDTKLNYE